MNVRKILPAAVALLMLVSVLGVVFQPASDADDDPLITDNLSEVGDAIGIGGTISFEDLVNIFAKDGGEDYVLDDEKLLGILLGGEPLLPDIGDVEDLNGDGEVVDDYILLIQYNVFSLLKVLEEKLGLDLSASVSIYGMAEVISKSGNDYVVKIDAAAKIDVSLGISLESRPIEGTYGEDNMDLLLYSFLMILFPEVFDEEDLSDEFDGFIPTMLEEEGVWVNLNIAIAASASGYAYMTKTEGKGLIINGILLDAKAGVDLNATTNAKIEVTRSFGEDEDIALKISYPDEVQTVGIRAGVSASLECAFSATSENSVMPGMIVLTEDGRTTLGFLGAAECLTYMHYDAFVGAEVYGNGADMLAPIMSIIPPEVSNGNGIALRMSGTMFEEDGTDPDDADALFFYIEKNRLELTEGDYIEYDEEEGEYTFSFGGMIFSLADDSPTLFGPLGGGSIVLDGQRKSSIMGSVNSIRSNMPGIHNATSKVMFFSGGGVKLKTVTVTNGEKIPESAFPVFNDEDYVIVGWASPTSYPALRELVTKDTVITNDLILIPIVAEDASGDLSVDGNPEYPIYQKVEDTDYDFGSFDLRGDRYADFYKDDVLVSKWYFCFGGGWDAENLKLNVKPGDHSTYTEAFGNKKMMLLEFDGSGEAPYETQVSVPVDGDFGSGLFAVYEITDDGPVLRSYGRASDGMATFNILDFSDHLIVKLDVDPAAANVGTGAGGSSSNTLLYIGIGGAVAAAAVAGGALFLRRP